MTPAEFKEFLKIAREEKVLAFEVGEVRVTFHSLALAPNAPQPNPAEFHSVNPPSPDAPKPMSYGKFSETEIFSG